MKRLGRQRLRQGSEQSESAGQVGEVMHEGSMDFTMDELREFLEADVLDVRVDPDFKERLRKKLWDLLQARTRGGGGEPGGEA